jgi:4a-hydroxytetrahydrobiopterin dehydratase
MPEPIAPSRFHEFDWRVLAYAACTHFRTSSYIEGARVAEAIGRLADESGKLPDLDLRANGLTVRLTVNEMGLLTEDDLSLAGAISTAARELGVNADLSHVQMIQIAIDALVIPDVMRFWEAVLGYRAFGDVLVDPPFEGPTVWFQQMDAPRPQRNRIHVDLYLPQDVAEARIAAALAAGGRIVNDEHAPHWWTLADPEGNEVDVAPWPDLDEEPAP